MSIFSCVFLFALDNTIVADVQPAIVEQFHDLELLPWLSVAFMLGAASTLLVWLVLRGDKNETHAELILGASSTASSTANGSTLSPRSSLKSARRSAVLLPA